MITTIPHELHRKRRAALSPYFSSANVRRLEPIIQDSLTKLLGRLDSCYKSGQVLPITVAYKAMTSDIITSYAFGKSTNYLLKEDFNISFFETIASVFEVAHSMLHIAWLGPLIQALPIPLLVKLLPPMGYMEILKLVGLIRCVWLRHLANRPGSNGKARSRRLDIPRIMKQGQTQYSMACSTAIFQHPKKPPQDCWKKPSLLFWQDRTPQVV